MAVNSDRAIPEQRSQCPSIRTSDGGQVHECWQAAVTPIGHRLIDQMGNEDDLCAPEVVTSPEEDPSGEEEVVQNEVGGDVGRCRDEDIVLGKEVPDIAELR